MFNISCNLLKAKDRMVLCAPMVYPRDYILTGGSDLPPMPSITREYHMHVGCPGKKKKKAKLRIRGAISIEHILLLHHHKEEKLLTIRSQGLLVHPLRQTRGLPFTKASRNSVRRT